MAESSNPRWLQLAGGKKFLLTLVVFLASCLLLWFGKISSGEWTALSAAIAGVYTAGNAFVTGKAIKQGAS